MSKAVFVGEYEFKKWKLEEVISILKKYDFDTVYLEEGVLPKSFYLHQAGFKCFAWIKFTGKTNEELAGLIGKYSGLIQGVCLDYVRCEDKFFPFGFLTLIPRLLRIKKLIRTFKELEWTACLKCEVFKGAGKDWFWFLFNELNRWFWGQPLIFMYKLFDKVLLMSYGKEYNVSELRVKETVKGIQERFSNVVPIWGTYIDKPVVDYTFYHKDIVKYSKCFCDNAFFRLGTCALESFS